MIVTYETVYRPARLFNGLAYRADGRCCAVRVDEQGRILSSSAVRCVWSGSPRFDGWFRERYQIVAVERVIRR